MSDGETETLATDRCPLCGWTGTTDDGRCPDCRYGTVDYKLTLHD